MESDSSALACRGIGGRPSEHGSRCEDDRRAELGQLVALANSDLATGGGGRDFPPTVYSLQPPPEADALQVTGIAARVVYCPLVPETAASEHGDPVLIQFVPLTQV